MERKKLELDNAIFDQFKTDDTKKIKKENLDKKKIEEIAKQQGFTKREQELKSKSEYTKQFNVKCKDEMNDLVTDILYHQKDSKLKKQELLEEAMLAYLEKNNLLDLVDKYKMLFS